LNGSGDHYNRQREPEKKENGDFLSGEWGNCRANRIECIGIDWKGEVDGSGKGNSVRGYVV
jgi:hypothetical protein